MLFCFLLYCPILSTKTILSTFDIFVKGKTHTLFFETWGFLLPWPAGYEAAAFPILGSRHQWGWMCNPNAHIEYEHSWSLRSTQIGKHTFILTPAAKCHMDSNSVNSPILCFPVQLVRLQVYPNFITNWISILLYWFILHLPFLWPCLFTNKQSRPNLFSLLVPVLPYQN